MDYSRDPSTNQHPNQHDYDELAAIYAHLDTSNTLLSSGTNSAGNSSGAGKPDSENQDGDLSDPSAWGNSLKKDSRGNDSLFVRDFGNGKKVFTFVIWTE